MESFGSALQHGFLLGYMVLPQILVLVIAVSIVMAYAGSPLWLWSLWFVGASWLFGLPIPVCAALAAALVVLNLRPVRRIILTSPVVALMRKINLLPQISETEKVALEAGTTWIDGELFSGSPNFDRILKEEQYPKLTADEQQFLDGPVEELCRMIDDWKIHVEREFPEKVWAFLKKEKFFGLIIPKSYGGLGFSALGHSAVVGKLSSRSCPVSTTVIVPNSLGPAELLLHYGTEAQKNHYLPRLASGQDIPCFGLTELQAGSDAGSLRSYGEIFRGEDGQIYIRLNWQKRYITLAAISTVIGLAFRLYDPEKILGGAEDLGITCALIPSDRQGVKLGRRHDPLGTPFFNCPTEGEGVVISIDEVIGGKAGVGNGWRMLMESLAAGRSVSLPAQATGGAKLATLYTSQYSMLRKQFGMSIGTFEGVQEPLARIGGLTWLLEAGRVFTCGAVDKGAKPSVVSAIVKYAFTETQRKIAIDAMDVSGGAGISMGPRNILGRMYQVAPIGITVEGSNILTRCMIIFGQGAIRCHPFAYAEVKALENKDLGEFDRIFFKHLGFIVRNVVRAKVHSLTMGTLASSGGARYAQKYVRRMEWASSVFATLSDLAMGSYGGRLKIKESLTSRYADALVFMYLGTCAIKRFEAEGGSAQDRPFFEWSMRYVFGEIQSAFDAIMGEIEVPGLTWAFRGPARAWMRAFPIGKPVPFHVHERVAQAMTSSAEVRDRLSNGVFVPKDENEMLARLAHAVRLAAEVEGPLRQIRRAVRQKELPKLAVPSLIELAVTKRIITEEQAKLIERAEEARVECLKVDEFTLEEYRNLGGHYDPAQATDPQSGVSRPLHHSA
jgi:acyl-CoA dehydrogenase